MLSMRTEEHTQKFLSIYVVCERLPWQMIITWPRQKADYWSSIVPLFKQGRIRNYHGLRANYSISIIVVTIVSDADRILCSMCLQVYFNIQMYFQFQFQVHFQFQFHFHIHFISLFSYFHIQINFNYISCLFYTQVRFSYILSAFQLYFELISVSLPISVSFRTFVK